MNLEWLTDYLTLVETGSFSRAAEKRALTHSAFGRRIKMLEEWAGVELIERTQPIGLTPAGKIFLKAAEDITTTMANVRLQLQGKHGAQSLRVSTGHILASHFFPKWYRALRDKTAFIPMTVLTASATYSIRRFIDKDADLLIAYKTPITDMLLASADYAHTIVGHETILPVTANRKKIRLDSLLSQRQPIAWLDYDLSLSLKSPLIAHLKARQILAHLHPVFAADSYSTLKRMVLEDIGIAWLPSSVMQTELKNQKLFIIQGEKLQFSVNIALFRHQHSDHPRLDTLWQEAV